ncbi:AMP-dependent synthetase [Sulfodiicoccus acidiphilus]|uniref:AMP-dependent synthetase n=1 Tax=Sulfodiicoccus acidiphilus TaxID=1670455 RepID=A0A348B4Y7_9CREN|nr:AMP-binding protein [Sulfodiicoccus acidiphilus]BBD73239.1 AMP-dependent synthetase [Sulfodiicoccus acidiphilus]
MAVITQNVPQFVVLEYAVWKLGGVLVPLNPMYTPRELEYYFRDSDAKVVVATCESLSKAREAAKGRVVVQTSPDTFHPLPDQVREKWKVESCEEGLYLKGRSTFHVEVQDPEDVALLVYTSGTTGDPKGAVIKHKNLYASSWIYREWFKFTPQDKVLGAAPLFHVTGLVFHVATSVLSGASLRLFYRFDPDLALSTVEEEKTTATMAAATAFIAMVPKLRGRDLKSMRLWSSGGMAVPLSLEKQWREGTGSWIYVAWGLTETTSPATLWPYPYEGDVPLDPKTNVVSSGIPVYYTWVKLVDSELVDGEEVGEIAVKGPQVVDGYWNKPEANAKTFRDGWLLTGDVAKLINGWVYIIDRKKDLINASGFKVYPREVEEVIYLHPAVEEVAVVGVPDPYRGETVKAFVKLKDGYSGNESLKRELELFCRERLAAYKVPREVEFVDEVPKTASGKILRRAFRA